MPGAPRSKPARRPRSDVERNRTRLLAAAKHAFAERGAAASLEQIARDAKVGIGTLYRHFPTRDALIEAVYRQETDTLIEAADRLMTQRKPAAAVREWLLLFVDFFEAKRSMAEVLHTLIGGPDALYRGTPARLAPPIGALVARAVEAGVMRPDIDPGDLLRAIGGVASMNPEKSWKRSAAGMVDVLLKGLERPHDVKTAKRKKRSV